MSKNKLWFKAKNYGWGWQPASWEGWTVLAVYIIFFVLAELVFIKAVAYAPGPVIAVFIGYMTLITGILIYISYAKGEKPEWRWGKPKK